MNPAAIWRAALGVAARRPLLFLIAGLLLAGTDLMLWAMGVYDGAGAQAGAGAKAGFLLVKVGVLLVWGLLALRLAGEPGLPLASALRLDRRQLGWIAGMLPALALLFALRIALTRLAQLLLPDPRAALIAGLILYLPVSLALLVGLLPAWIGVLLGDDEASFGWSWRAMRGQVIRSVLIVILAIAPVAAVHVGLNLLPMAGTPMLRAASLLADGLVMALFMAIAAASYRALWLRAKAAP
jgi:hypothetical protein